MAHDLRSGAVETRSESLARRSVRSFAWEAVSKFGQQAVAVVSTAILARLLSPSEYGVMGMAALFVNFASTFSQLGIPAAIVQRKNLDDDTVSSLFWLNLLVGVGITGGLVLIAPAAAGFFRQPMVKDILPVLALTFTIAALGNIHHALFYREMNLRPPAMAQFASSAAGLIAAVLFALRGAGVWSLVASSLASRAVDTVLMWVLHPWRPRIRARSADFRSVARFGLNLSGFSIVNYLSRNGDNIIIGRFLGSASLGFYQNAYSLMFYPQQAITSVLSSVALAPLSKVQNVGERFRSGVLKISGFTAMALFPAMLGLAATADLVVAVVLGPKWGPAGPVLAILAFAGLMQSAIASTGQILIAKGRTDLLFRLSLAAATVNVLGFLIGIRWGIMGVATGYAAANAVLLYPILRVALRLIDLPVRTYSRVLAAPLGASAAMAIVVIAWRWTLAALGVGSAPVLCATSVLAGVVFYVAAMLWFWPPVMDFLFNLVALPERFERWLFVKRRNHGIT